MKMIRSRTKTPYCLPPPASEEPFRRLVLAGLLAAVVPFTVAAGPDNQPANQAECFDAQGASGLDLIQAEFRRDGTIAGTFRLVDGKIGSGTWTEEGPGYPGKVRFHYRETARGPCAVELYDPSRDARVELDIRTKTVRLRERGSGEPKMLGEIERTYGEKGVWARGGGTAYGNPP